MKKIITFFILSLSFNLNAGIIGTWNYQSESKDRSYQIVIKNDHKKTTVEYTFIYNSGEKINEHNNSKSQILLNELNENCYSATIYDDFFDEKSNAIFCENSNYLYFMKVSNSDNTPYIPSYLTLKKIE
jgi:hypothetical protein